jgi:hypothetical protein
LQRFAETIDVETISADQLAGKLAADPEAAHVPL